MNISELKKCYNRGDNITGLLKENGINVQKGIELSYDLQAGSYSEYALNHRDKIIPIANEMGSLLKQHIQELNTILDCGTGKMTTLTEVLQYLPGRIETLAFDISLSRIRAGREYVARTQGTARNEIRSFVAAMDGIPLANDSVDIVITSHALEPNHGRETELLAELFRVSCGKVILFEPSWEKNTEEGRRRMDKLGYVRELPQHIEKLGGMLDSVVGMSNAANPLNPTYCYIISLNKTIHPLKEGETPFVCPNSGELLSKRNGYYWSPDGGYAYPIIEGVPVLRKESGVLMTRAV
jgi:uncharacterized protein YbaR (Trm112 family)